MSGPNYVILKPVQKASYCYLWEVIQWRAFGIFPEEYWDYEGRDGRTAWNEGEYFDVSIPHDNRQFTDLSPEQTNFAGLPPDPSFDMLTSDEYYLELSEYDKRIEKYTQILGEAKIDDDSFDLEQIIDDLKSEKGKASSFWQNYRSWRISYENYLDQFQSELLINLRKGKIKAKGRLLPHRDKSKSERIFNAKGYWTIDIEPREIPSELWVSKYVNWQECLLKTPDQCLVWITVDVEEMLSIFPPSELLPGKQLQSLGRLYAIAENALTASHSQASDRRGRPPLPWQDFNVEVARHYRDGTMPEKKEAAIQLFIDWFKTAKGINASRSAVGEKLKPYFDALKPSSNSDRK